jgi:hypothetical protein
MVEFTINKNKYAIDDLTIGQYYRIQNLLTLEGDSSRFGIISELSSCPQEELRKLDAYQFNFLWVKVYDDLMNSYSDQKFQTEIEVKGSKYVFVDLSKLTVGEMVDMDVLRADPNKDKMLHKMMAILYRPLRKRWFKVEAEPYDSDSLESRAEIFLDMPMKHVYGAITFFLRIPVSLLKATLDSLTKEATSKKDKEMYASLNQIMSELLEPGSERSLSSLETILLRLKKLNEVLSSQLSTGSLTERTKSSKKKSRFASFVRSKNQK